jgi:hypothetical protein
MSAPTRKIFNATSQQVEDAELSVDDNNEIIATFADNSFLKFPAGLTAAQFDAQISAIQKSNVGKQVITPETEAALAKERANSLALIGAAPESPAEPTNGDTTPEDNQTNDPPAPANPSVN